MLFSATLIIATLHPHALQSCRLWSPPFDRRSIRQLDTNQPQRRFHSPAFQITSKLTSLRPTISDVYVEIVGNKHMSSVGLGESEQRTFPTKTFPERCYGSDVWYPKYDALVPHVLPTIPYYSTTSKPLPTPIPNLKREGEGKGARAPPRPSRLTRDDFAWPSHVLPTDRQTPPASRVDPAWEHEAIGERAASRTSACARSVKSN